MLYLLVVDGRVIATSPSGAAGYALSDTGLEQVGWTQDTAGSFVFYPPAQLDVPTTVSKLQFYEQALATPEGDGTLWSVVEATLAANPAANMRFQMTTNIRRDDPDFSAMAASLGMADAQIDEFFIGAAKRL